MTPFNSTALYDGAPDVSPEMAEAARQKVAAYATDDADRDELLAMLGLTP